jgi:hypothetical protein
MRSCLTFQMKYNETRKSDQAAWNLISDTEWDYYVYFIA